MARVAGQIVDDILRKVRDPGGVAHEHDFVRTLVSDTQRHVNGGGRLVLADITLPLIPFQQVYVITPDPANWITCLRVEQVRIDEAELPRERWRSFHAHDPQWFRRAADRPEAWAPLGRDMLLLWPAVQTEGITATIRCTTITTALTSDNTLTDIPDERLPVLEHFVERMLLLRQRMFVSVPATRDELLRDVEQP